MKKTRTEEKCSSGCPVCLLFFSSSNNSLVSFARVISI